MRHPQPPPTQDDSLARGPASRLRQVRVCLILLRKKLEMGGSRLMLGTLFGGWFKGNQEGNQAFVGSSILRHAQIDPFGVWAGFKGNQKKRHLDGQKTMVDQPPTEIWGFPFCGCSKSGFVWGACEIHGGGFPFDPIFTVFDRVHSRDETEADPTRSSPFVWTQREFALHGIKWPWPKQAAAAFCSKFPLTQNIGGGFQTQPPNQRRTWSPAEISPLDEVTTCSLKDERRNTKEQKSRGKPAVAHVRPGGKKGPLPLALKC